MFVGYTLVFISPVLWSTGTVGHDPDRHANDIDLSQLPFELPMAVSLLAIIALLGWTRQTRVMSRPARGGLWYVIPYLLFRAMLLAIGASQGGGASALQAVPPSFLLSLLALTLLVGVFEETLFRGVVLFGFEARFGPYIAVLGSSVLSGAMHYVNWIGGQDFAETTAQVVSVGLSGLFLGVLALRTRSIWPGVVLHGLWDATVTLNTRMAPVPVMSDDPAPAMAADSDFFGDAVALILNNFEPIYALIVLFGYYTWTRAKVPRGG